MNGDDSIWAKRFGSWGALLVTAAVFGLFYLGLIVSARSPEPPAAFTNLMETIKALALLVVGYWVGSSNSSQKKDETIAKSAEALAVSAPVLTTITETKANAPSVTTTRVEPKTE